MIYKPYGKTGKDVSVIGFGGMRFQKKGSRYDTDACVEMVHTASQLGINYFDTAPYYCDDKSESLMGEAFKSMPNPFYVSTKSSENSGSKLRAQLEKSLKRLNVQKINFFHIWCVLDLDGYKKRLVPGGAYEAAMKAKSEGLIDHVVMSTHCNGDEIATMLEDNLFEGVLLGYNVLNAPFRKKGLEAALKHNLGVATMNPLGGGLIPQHEDLFSFIRTETDQTSAGAAIRFNASHDAISTVLCGMGSLDEVKRNAAIGNQFTPYPAEKMLDIAAQMSSKLDSLCTGCDYCKGCPQDIPVSKFMLAYNEAILKDKQTAKGMINWHWGLDEKLAKTCIECGLCEDKCTQHLPIIERLKIFG